MCHRNSINSKAKKIKKKIKKSMKVSFLMNNIKGRYSNKRTTVTLWYATQRDSTAERRLWMQIRAVRDVTLGGQVDDYWRFEGHRKPSWDYKNSNSTIFQNFRKTVTSQNSCFNSKTAVLAQNFSSCGYLTLYCRGISLACTTN
jgi:hypothetical protein